ncbi:d3ef7aa8-5fd1-4981-b66c-2da95462206b [Thermothielavioides terrestris]|uniref:D3ef7aa8-5fd1-4981-b66c-2da95462206b n=1 Tax=Thermothielavioides terrestris TaxID=2587410 RepID=A0A3S4C514_9PEZI|nr:d3ef7aa8-5fd1-4981-b66c-2da95462206b [Thermothielavioides terrestris]
MLISLAREVYSSRPYNYIEKELEEDIDD